MIYFNLTQPIISNSYNKVHTAYCIKIITRVSMKQVWDNKFWSCKNFKNLTLSSFLLRNYTTFKKIDCQKNFHPCLFQAFDHITEKIGKKTKKIGLETRFGAVFAVKKSNSWTAYFVTIWHSRATLFKHLFFDPRPSTIQSRSLKSGSLFLVMVSVRPYKTKHTDQRVKPFFKLVLWLVLGRGSLYDRLKSCIYFLFPKPSGISRKKIEEIFSFFHVGNLGLWLLSKCALDFCCLITKWIMTPL